jgi:hypothetical protein
MGDPSMRYMKKGEYAFRIIAGEGVLVPIKSGVGELDSIFTMNELGTSIWGLIGPEKTASEIVRCVCEEYEVSEAQAARDVEKFIATLQERGLIEPAPVAEVAHGMP